MYNVDTIERDGCIGKIEQMDDAEMPDFDGSGHIFTAYRDGWGGVRIELLNADNCAGTGDNYREITLRQADEMETALAAAIEKWGWDFDLIQRYFRAFFGASIDYTDWGRDGYMFAIAPRALREAWGNPEGTVDLDPYKAYRDGEVYGYVVETEDGDELDSCWGYYGDREMDYIRSQINDAINDHVESIRSERTEMFRRLINNR